LLIGSDEVDPSKIGDAEPDAEYLLEHPKLPFISYPYEWPFSALKDAAVAHLNIHLALLKDDLTLSDASAYNMQFWHGRPIFIDRLSVSRYEEGSFWIGHRQFCEQFLNPLLLYSKLGVAYQPFFRGTQEGISSIDLARLLKWRHLLSPNVFTHVYLQAKLQAGGLERSTDELKTAAKKKLPKRSFEFLLMQLKSWIRKLQPFKGGYSDWGDYADTHTYDNHEAIRKSEFVGRFCQETNPEMLWDLGCNTGEYSEVALNAGSASVVGFDFDDQALERAYGRLSKQGKNFLALKMDAANPSPSQGWREAERKGFRERVAADAIIALAFEHHIAIGKNVGLEETISWLTSLAPAGVIEFVPGDDPTVQRMLALRRNIFDDYSKASFEKYLGARSRIVSSEVVSETGRALYWFDRTDK
jgi:ribosomal protein L11 methylase PrmA